MLLCGTTPALADPNGAPSVGGDVNAANSPLTPKITVNLQDYYVPDLNRVDDRTANQFLLRGLVPVRRSSEMISSRVATPAR
jgi:hypothetical protein